MVVEKSHTEVETSLPHEDITNSGMKLKNSDILANLGAKLQHLSPSQQVQLSSFHSMKKEGYNRKEKTKVNNGPNNTLHK